LIIELSTLEEKSARSDRCPRGSPFSGNQRGIRNPDCGLFPRQNRDIDRRLMKKSALLIAKFPLNDTGGNPET
jgi:hypothetical protein